MSIGRETIRGHLETVILSVLGSRPGHGFEILRRIEARGNGALKLKEGSVYPALYRLEEAGNIRGRWESESVRRRGPRRRVYRITSEGRKKLATERDRWRAFVEMMQSLLETGK